MYRFLSKFGLPAPIVALLTAIWFASLAFATMYALFEPQAELKYMTL